MDVEVPHTNFTEVAGMVFVKVNTMMMLTTSVTATSRMFPMLANTAMTMGHMSTKLPGLLLVRTHGSCNKFGILLSVTFKRIFAGILRSIFQVI